MDEAKPLTSDFVVEQATYLNFIPLPTGLGTGTCGKSNGPVLPEGPEMWVSKSIYESLPYFYLSAGAISLLASMYLNHWHWPTICFVLGISTLVGGLVLFLKRRDFRHHNHRGRPRE